MREQDTGSRQSRKARHAFEDSEGLRALLTRLHTRGRGAWRDDP